MDRRFAFTNHSNGSQWTYRLFGLWGYDDGCNRSARNMSALLNVFLGGYVANETTQHIRKGEGYSVRPKAATGATRCIGKVKLCIAKSMTQV